MEDKGYIRKNYLTVSNALSALSKLFDNISIPLKQSFYYDILVEKEFKIYKVKVVYTECRQPNGNYVANIRKSGGYSLKKEIKSPFNPVFCDYIFVESPEETLFIPSIEIQTKRAITLSHYRKFQLNRLAS